MSDFGVRAGHSTHRQAGLSLKLCGSDLSVVDFDCNTRTYARVTTGSAYTTTVVRVCSGARQHRHMSFKNAFRPSDSQPPAEESVSRPTIRSQYALLYVCVQYRRRARMRS